MMKQNWWGIILVIFFLIGCSDDNLTEEEILEKTIEKTEELESYAFELYSEQIDGVENSVVLELKGKTHTKPFQAKIDKKQNLMEPEESVSYYKDGTIYHDFQSDTNHFFKMELDDQPDHYFKGLKELSSNIDQLAFSEEEDAYTYEYVMESEAETDRDLLTSLYPFFIGPELMVGSHLESNLEYSDITDFQVIVKIDKQNFLVKEISIHYDLDYDVLDTGDPYQLSETIEVAMFDHNEVKAFDMPDEQIEDAQTFMEYWGFEEENQEKKEPAIVEETLGNTGANLMDGNGGSYATDGDRIYYSYHGESLHRIKKDGSNKMMLSENEVSQINVIDDWLFFIDRTEDSRLYRMNKDGTNRKQVTEEMVSSLMVVNDWVYYIPIINTPSGDLPLERVQTDGTNKERVLDKVLNFTVGQDHIVYREEHDDWLRALNLKDEKENSLDFLLHGTSATQFAIAGGWLYFIDGDDENRLYRKNLSGWELEQLTESSSSGFNISGNYLFFKNNDDNGSLYRYNIATETTEEIEEGEVHQLQIINNHLYFAKAKSLETIEWYRIEVGGSSIEKIEF